MRAADRRHSRRTRSATHPPTMGLSTPLFPNSFPLHPGNIPALAGYSLPFPAPRLNAHHHPQHPTPGNRASAADRLGCHRSRQWGSLPASSWSSGRPHLLISSSPHLLTFSPPPLRCLPIELLPALSNRPWGSRPLGCAALTAPLGSHP